MALRGKRDGRCNGFSRSEKVVRLVQRTASVAVLKLGQSYLGGEGSLRDGVLVGRNSVGVVVVNGIVVVFT